MQFTRTTVAVFVVGLCTLVMLPAVFACECVAPARDDRKISDEFENSETVITATMVYEPDPEVWIGEQTIKMRVDKVYKGHVVIGDILAFGQAGGKDCLWFFSKEKVGKAFLFYLGRPSKARPYKITEETERSDAESKYYVSTCGRSAEIDKAGDDMAYLDKLPSPKPRQP